MGRVVVEAKAGDGLYVLETFRCSPLGQDQSWKTATEFLAGMRVKYKGFRKYLIGGDENRPLFMITFEHEGVDYEATQDYFLTFEAWAVLTNVFGAEREGLKKHGLTADNTTAERNWVVDWAVLIVALVLIAGAFWMCAGVLEIFTRVFVR